MAHVKPTGGFATQREAVMTLGTQGLSPAEIAEKLDIPPGNVRSVLSQAASRMRRQSRRIELPKLLVRQLQRHADSRFIGVDDLAMRILRAVAEGRLVGAVLDDGRE